MVNNIRKKKLDRAQLKKNVLKAASTAFMLQGIKNVRMDDLASCLAISKRTLYELFCDKEELLIDVMKIHREEMRSYMEHVASNTENVLEIIIAFYEKISTDFQKTSPAFFEDIKKYPKVVSYLEESRRENIDSAMAFYQKGVAQELFLPNINYYIIQKSLSGQMDMLMKSSYTLAEIFETLIFVHMRGISTEKGMKIVDDFWTRLKNEHKN